MSERTPSHPATTYSNEPRTSVRAAHGGHHHLADSLDVAAFYVIVLVVAMRPLLSETYYSGLESVSRQSASLGDPTPATTAWLDFAFWAAAVAAAVGALLQRRRWHLTGIEIGAGILLVAAVISTLAASNKRLAINGSANWLTALALVMLMANLCRDRMRIGLLLAALGASGLASMARCTMQVKADFADTRQHYEKTKTDFWAKQGVPLDDPRVELYERRLRAGEASGFFALSNTQGAWLSLAGFSILGLRGLVIRKRWPANGLLVVALATFAMIWWTGSKGAMIAATIGLVAWVVLTRVQDDLRSRWRLALAGGWLCVAGLVCATITYGAATGRLPTDSLRFRWNYWQVARQIITDHVATGVGALNFDSAYLARKPIQYPEEIRDPHNFVLAVLAQWGLLGGVGLVFVLVGASIVSGRIWGRREPTDGPPPMYDPLVRLQWIVAIAIGFFILRVWLMRGWLGDTSGSAYVFFDLGLYGLTWIVGFAGLRWLARGGWTGDLDCCQVACLAGVLAFLLHSLIDVAMLYPGTLMPFAAMAGILLVVGPAGRKLGAATVGGAGPAAIAVVGTLALVVFTLVPVSRSNSLLSQARFLTPDPTQARRLYEQAAEVDPLDPTAPADLAGLLAASGDPADRAAALQAIGQATVRDPQQVGLYRMKAGLLEQSYRQTRSMADLIAAVGTARKVALMYPSSPDDHVMLGDLLVEVAAAEGGGESLGEAAIHYRTALDLDAARGPQEVRRWPPARRQLVETCLRRLQKPTTTRPAGDPTT
ncbi:MAG: O-antigen ligase family protein [Planctomycetes bacterium]|nr:O-antigen ligase family protein [Planctomycetota bacterium]